VDKKRSSSSSKLHSSVLNRAIKIFQAKERERDCHNTQTIFSPLHVIHVAQNHNQVFAAVLARFKLIKEGA
jgi:hypothetical protein